MRSSAMKPGASSRAVDAIVYSWELKAPKPDIAKLLPDAKAMLARGFDLVTVTSDDALLAALRS